MMIESEVASCSKCVTCGVLKAAGGVQVLLCRALFHCKVSCHGTSVKVQNGWLVYGPMLVPRQLRFSLYSGAVITEGQVL